MNDDKTTQNAPQTQAIAIRSDTRVAGPLRPIVKPAVVIEAHKETTELIKAALEEGRDYGAIKGADQNRKVLLKAGAERISIAFGLRPQFTIVESTIDHGIVNTFSNKYKGDQTSQGLYRFTIKCELYREDVLVGEGLGSCSTMESKYISRPRDCENTVLKMAKKRAFVDAVVTTLSLSDRFSQDLDDAVDDDEPTPPQRQPRNMHTAPAQTPTVDKSNQEYLREKISAMFDALGIDKALRAEYVQRTLGRKPATLDDLSTVLNELIAQVEARATRQVTGETVEGEIENESEDNQ
jgi:hypothetical protein